MMTKQRTSENTKHIVLLTRWSRFPDGMAASQRIAMIGRAILCGGDKIRVLCLVPLQQGDNELSARGEHCGIPYEYTAGSTKRSKSFWVRRWHSIKGATIGFVRLLQYKLSRQLDCLYIYDRAYNIQYLDIAFIMCARILGVPVIREMNERPWAMKESPSFLEKLISPLWGVRGAIVISGLIGEWVISEGKTRGQNTAIAHIPILTDIDEIGTNQQNGDCYVLFAGSPSYDETVRFILDAMDIVWQRHADCKLYLTGFGDEDSAGRWISKEAARRQIADKIKICGYLTRTELLNTYVAAKGLLIPLFDDVRSKARFPTKIGEYLTSSVPIITNNIGEISYYFTDGENAFISDAGNYSAYAQKIIECLFDEIRSRRIGLAGRQVAEQQFYYASYAEKLGNFFKEVKNGPTNKDSRLRLR